MHNLSVLLQQGAINVHVDIMDFDSATPDDLINRADFVISGPPGESDATTGTVKANNERTESAQRDRSSLSRS